MGRSPDRNARSNLIMRVLEGQNGWDRSPHNVKAGPEWVKRFPNLPFVRDGREETGNTRAGRGTTAFDLFRSFETEVEVNWGRETVSEVVRSDFLSVKTDNIGDDNKLPSKIELSTGLDRTLEALMEGVQNGASIPTLLFCSKTEENEQGEYPSPWGLVLFLDLAPILRQGVASIWEQPEGGYGKGKAPLCYYKWSSARKCGGGDGGNRGDESCDYGARLLHFEQSADPFYDSMGRKWSAPDKVHYPELVISLSQLGIKRSSWREIHVSELADFLEEQDWQTMSGDNGTLIG